ncbi:unnamed protein product [Rotaria sordida]|uniref:Ion transport domain-containing protein n=1 Tax=Rotaria sordida TaxID=392033 RepID=A0A814VLE2_9BILA|nr:unnamed protein product [Rotaria sordida]
MQSFDTTLVSSDANQSDPIVDRKSSHDYRRLIRKGRSVFQTNDLLSVPEDPDIINVEKLFEVELMKTKKLKDDKNLHYQDRITINVSGLHFETLKSTLAFYPDTLLGEEALAQIRTDENLKELRKISLPRNPFRRYLWATLEHPEFSFIAKFIQILSVFIILLSTMALAVETLPKYKNLSSEICSSDTSEGNSITIGQANSTDQSSIAKSNCHTYFSSPFTVIQTVCVIYFTLELILRMISMPSLCGFIKDLMNWIDILAILPYYIGLAIFFSNGGSNGHSNAQAALQLLRILRFVRVFKFYRVFRNIKAIRVLAITLSESIVDFIILAVLLTLLGFVFGAIVYYIENDVNPTVFNSIFTATYWGMITITTVGYGDLAPATPGGRIIACFCAISGTGTIAMLTSILVDRYQRVYNRRLYIKPKEIHFDDIFNNESGDLELKPRRQDRYSQTLNDIHDVQEQQQQDILRIDQDQYPTQKKDNEENSDSSVTNTIDHNENQIHFIEHDLPNTISAVYYNKNRADSNMEFDSNSNNTEFHITCRSTSGEFSFHRKVKF